ncbi:MAG: M48 family metalloprotease [Candidatus Eremiobacteraeota bacterium]|nr:M48 family metalloprotease [Candidatus Eremiobacteraeota bacterium]
MAESERKGAPSFAFRAAVAIALMIGFYALALGIVALSIYLPYAELHYANRIYPELLIVGIVMVYSILKGCIFISAPFVAPGPQVRGEDEPRLFQNIRDVAEKIKTRMPDAVYLIPDVNAFVAEVGGFMGMGTRRIMAVGLGLLAVDSVGSFKATIAHEFGHYLGGDTTLGGFIYRVRESMIRVVENLGDSWLAKPFEWYAMLFLRITHSISRQQELAADRASVEIAGKEAHIAGLRSEMKAGLLYSGFLDNEMAPIIEEGRFPSNLYQGLRTYMKSHHDEGLEEKLEKAIMEQKTDPYDTHPSLSERLAYAESLPDPHIKDEEEPALSLLKDPRAAEVEVSTFMASSIPVEKKLVPIEWDDVSHEVHVPRARRYSEEYLKQLREAYKKAQSPCEILITLMDEIKREDIVVLAERIIGGKAPAGTPPGEVKELAQSFLMSLLAMVTGAALTEKGGTWQTAVGKSLSVRFQGEECEIFKWAEEAVRDTSKMPELEKRLEALGIKAPSSPGS